MCENSIEILKLSQRVHVGKICCKTFFYVMKEYQSTKNIVASVNNNFVKLKTAPIKATTIPNKRGPIKSSASPTTIENNLLLQSESGSLEKTSTLSISHNSFDWSEFEQNYNSIMDNTNLMDSCAAALSDITNDDDVSFGSLSKPQIDFNQTISPANSSASMCGGNHINTSKHISVKDIEMFKRWLCEMELRVAEQPTLSQIFAMDPDEMAVHLKIHSKIFNNIVAQPCIVKGSNRKDFKSIEERYHLLYLKAYEVLLLLEGLPNDNNNHRYNSNKILNKSFYDNDDFDDMAKVKETEDDCIVVDHNYCVVNGDTSDNINTVNSSAIYTESNKMAANLGTYYFKYEQSESQSIHSKPDESVINTENDNNVLGDKELTFSTLYDNELRSFLNCASDNQYISANDYTLVTEPDGQLSQQYNADEIKYFSQENQFWNDLDISTVAHSPNLPGLDDAMWPSHCINLDAHNKVRNWLFYKTGYDSNNNSIKSKSTASLERASSENGSRVLYKCRSEMNLNSTSLMQTSKWSSSFRTSMNCFPSMTIPLMTSELRETEEFASNCSLDWDDYQQNIYNSKYQADGESYGDADLYSIAKDLCYFGNDYSLHLNSSIIDDHSQSEPVSSDGVLETTTADMDSTTNDDASIVQAKQQKRIRRNRTKRNKRRQNQIIENSVSDKKSTATSDTTSISSLTEPSLLASTLSLNSANFEKCEQSEPVAPQTPQIPSQTIKYDSNENKFEFYSDEQVEPKKHKVSELRPDDFYDIIKMCQQNIDCVITVLGAEPNRILTIAYCQEMKYKRNGDQFINKEPLCSCASNNNIVDSFNHKIKSKSSKCSSNQCCLDHQVEDTCLCAWVSQTIAMILNFLMDCWNIFRNMKLYMYLCKVVKGFFGSTRQVADHLKMKQHLVSGKALKYW